MLCVAFYREVNKSDVRLHKCLEILWCVVCHIQDAILTNPCTTTIFSPVCIPFIRFKPPAVLHFDCSALLKEASRLLLSFIQIPMWQKLNSARTSKLHWICKAAFSLSWYLQEVRLFTSPSSNRYLFKWQCPTNSLWLVSSGSHSTLSYQTLNML